MRSATTLLTCLFSCTVCFAEPSFRLFDSAASPPLVAELSLPLTDLLRKRADKEAVQGLLEIGGQSFSVELTPRGKSRLKHCSFPPLWLKLDKAETAQTMFHKQNRLKLVTHCKKSMSSRSYLAAELLAYRMLNILTPYSFRVQPLSITYVDTKKQKAQQYSAFLIEHKKHLAKRMQLEILEQEKISRTHLATDYAALAELFQYLIGNTDFSFVRGPPDDDCCHNTVPMRDVEQNIFSIAYDFDSSGLVNPPYGVPAGNLGQKRLTQRKFRGYCAHLNELQAARLHFLAHKGEILELINTLSSVPNLNRKKALKFINSFFATLESDPAFQQRIVSRCRK